MAHLAFLGSRLEAATADASPLNDEARALLSSQANTSVPLPPFAVLTAALGVPSERALPSALTPTARLPMRVLGKDAGTEAQADDRERALWREITELGLHELLTAEMVDALADRIRARVSHAVLSGLAGRRDLNGQQATVLGPVDEKGRIPVRIEATRECVRARAANVHGSAHGCPLADGDALPVVLEVGAGNGALAVRLASRLAGWARVVATDNGHARIRVGNDVEVVSLDCEAALRRFTPRVVLCSWMPSGVDLTGAIRECQHVTEYILLGEADSSTCGDEWATWGIVPPNGDEYAIYEDTPKAFEADGFVRAPLESVSRWQVCRFDSAAVRGFSAAVCFTRRDAPSLVDAADGATPAAPAEDLLNQDTIADGESLEASWERMQRSVAAGRAQRLDVQMNMDSVRQNGLL